MTETRAPTRAGWARTHRCRKSVSTRSTTILDTIVEPTVAWLRKNDIDYRGVLYAGLMLTHDGPKVIEYNVALR